ncbi:MAG: glycoside hydrolase family 55 protein [Pirellulales bacterium]|nr:glycoside hydrolase family 55 protein [Pirellulales bacterium]
MLQPPARRHAPQPGVYVEHYGAAGDGASDDTAALQKSIDTAGHGGLVRFSPGRTYLITHPLHVPYDNHTWFLHGATIQVAFPGVGITFGSPLVSNEGICVYGGTVRRDIDWTQGNVGVRFVNTNYSAYYDFEISGFEHGLELIGENNFGNAYFTGVPRRIGSCRFALYLFAHRKGWVNENVFLGGGRLGYYSSDPDASGAALVALTRNTDKSSPDYTANELNNNKFYGLCLENGQPAGRKPLYAIFANCQSCLFSHLRYEGFDDPFIDANTADFVQGGNVFDGGIGLTRPLANMRLPAQAAAFRFYGSQANWVGGGSQPEPLWTWSEVHSSTDVSVRLRSTGNNDVFQIYGDGRMAIGTGGAKYGRLLQGTLAGHDFGSVPSQGFATAQVAVPGAQLGDVARVAFTQPLPPGAILTAQITAANQATATLVNLTAAGLRLPAGDLHVDAQQR